ncbi:hypothetical protein [Vibrio parahaemolyticus]|uniref:hypothetical protein n=1 Tax=Vibrio parahaemolyticus TaxID=670 RepID=UPI0005F26D40|nr:hypothetical protein [Vibrio parahaemolyticus]KJR15247.1 hypothetical protein UF28_16410 [Vibrio parahaemolyticus]
MLLNQRVQFLALKELAQNTKERITNFLKTRKEKKLDNTYKTLCESFSFILNPYELPERYVALKGELFRVQFMPEGIKLTDEHNNAVEDKLLRLQILQFIKEQQ